jgi:hypothetical protein
MLAAWPGPMNEMVEGIVIEIWLALCLSGYCGEYGRDGIKCGSDGKELVKCVSLTKAESRCFWRGLVNAPNKTTTGTLFRQGPGVIIYFS